MNNSAKKNILITIDWFLPGSNSGGPVRSIANMLEHMSDVNFFILTRNTDYCSNEEYPDVVPNTWIPFAPHVQVYYFSKEQLTKKNMTRVIAELHPDVVYINGVYSRFFSILPLNIARKLHLKTVVAARGMLSPHALAVKVLKKKLFLKLANSRDWYKEVVFHATQEQESTDIQQVIKKFRSIEVIPNFPRGIKDTEMIEISKTKGEVRFIALGRIAEEKGTLVSIEALQKVEGNVRLDLYGTIYDTVYWEKCQEKINTLPEGIKVHYMGNLNPDEVMTTLMNYHFLLLPSKGENFGHSILEAFLANRPVIISKHTPWKDLEEKQMGFDVTEEELLGVIQKAVSLEEGAYQKLVGSIALKRKDLLNIEQTQNEYLKLFS
jgi:glycosyltransferase involved in cell wall biosynthesis